MSKYITLVVQTENTVWSSKHLCDNLWLSIYCHRSAQEQYKLLYLYSIIPNLTIKLISEISINLFNSVFSLPCGREKVTNRKGERKLNFGPSSWSSNVISYPIYVVLSVLCIVSVSSRLLKIYSKYEMMISFSSSKSIVLLLCTCVASSYSTHFLLS